ncbi:CHASE domain-containing protein [Deinococcus sp.]|uniref:CHASE domain-containing protein n=1 Tax=Deinococcus sp. TaxID=47478 RepID=UPI0025BFB976|nr:CHASE domain-containing protein [Deinococcus sp.]
MTSRLGRFSHWHVRWSRSLPLAVLLLVMLLSAALSTIISHFTLQQQQVRFEREVSAHTTATQQRLLDFDKLLQATRAFWLANPADVTPTEFQQFSQALQLSERYSDVQALGYVTWLPRGSEATLETLVASLGLTNYHIFPAQSGQAMRSPIVLISPLNGSNMAALGYDMMSEPIRRAAIQRAARADSFQVTSRVLLVQTDPQGRHYPGFLMLLPIWHDSPAALAHSHSPEQLQGFMYLAVRADLFLQSLDTVYGIPGISSQTLLGGTPLLDGPVPSGRFHQTDRLNLGGLNWTINYAAPEKFGQDIFTWVPLMTVLAGLGVAFLAYRVMLAQVQARERVEAINDSLQEAQIQQDQARAEFEAIFQSMQDAAAFTDEAGSIRMVNRAMNRQFRFRRGQLDGQPLSGLHVDRNLDSRRIFQAITTPYQRSDGSQFQGEAQRTEVRGQSGELLGLLEVVRDVSERVQTEQALHSEQRRSRDVLDGIPHILWVSDPAGQVTYRNAQHRHRLGPEHVRQRVNPEDLATYTLMWENAYSMLTQSYSEVRLRVGEGKDKQGAKLRDRWFEIRVAPLLTPDGQASEWVASATDIHDRLLAERLAQRNEERYRGVIEGMPQIVWLTNPKGEATYFNSRWAEYVGAERSTQGLIATIHPGDRAEYQLRWEQALKAGRNFEAEHRLLGADGVYRTFVTRGLPVRDNRGQIIEWVGTSTDVDASVYAENASRLLADVSSELTNRVNDPLAARAAKYESVLSLITQRFMVAATIWTMPDYQVLVRSQVNEKWSLPHLQETVYEIVRQVAETEEPVVVPVHPLLHVVEASGAICVPLIGLDGSLRGVLGLAYRQELHDRDHELVGELSQRLASALDNDALRDRAQAAQNQLQALNQSLEERVQRRTNELEEANRELEAFSYSVSHDLRTPLRHVVGFGDLLRKDAADTLSPKSTRYLNVITEAAARMNVLIDSLLEFSRMGRMPIRTVPVALGTLVQTAWDHLEPDRLQRQVSFELGELPTIKGDPTLLDLVFQNLLSNALKYTRTRKQAHIRVSGVVRGQEVTVQVQDNGVGFDPKYADKLFGVFQRLHRDEEFDGTGIGLANVRRIVLRHGGQVSAETVLGEGAIFSVTLPLSARPEEP